jgi:hypothetical protein
MDNDARHIIWDRVRTGLIPWVPRATWRRFRHKLNDIPKDDWDLTPRRFLVEFDEGALRLLRLNPLTYESQIAPFMNKRYSVPQSASALLCEYREEMDPLPSYFEKRIIVDATEMVTTVALYEDYLSWCRDEARDAAPLPQAKLNTELHLRFGVKDTSYGNVRHCLAFR